MISHNHSGIAIRKHEQKTIFKGGSLMGAAQRKRRSWRASKEKGSRQKAAKRLEASRPQMVNGYEHAESEKLDKLLLSSLRYWEATRDLIEERMDALRRRGSHSGQKQRQSARLSEAEATS